MLTFEQLEALREVVAAGSFSRAAECLYLSQPALSHRIRNLEHAVGKELIDRRHSGRELRLTPAGEAVLRFAADAEAGWKALQQELATGGAQRRRQAITLACGPTAAQHVIGPMLAGFHAQYPHVRVDTIELVAGSDLINAVRHGAADIAIGPGGPLDEQWEVVPLLSGSNVLIACPGHPLLAQSQVTSDNLKRFSFLTVPVSTGGGKAQFEWLTSQGLELDIAAILSTFDAVKEAVIHGAGLAFLPDFMLHDEVRQGRIAIVDYSGPSDPYSIHLIRLRKPARPPIVEELWQYIREQCRGLEPLQAAHV